MKKRFLLLFAVLVIAISATGCGEDPKLAKFRTNTAEHNQCAQERDQADRLHGK